MNKYLFFLIILLLPVSLAYATSYSTNNPTEDTRIQDDDNDDNCEASPGTINEATGAGTIAVGRQGSASATDCYRAWFEWPLTSVPTSGITIVDVDIIYQISAISGSGPDACDWVALSSQPSVRTPTQIWSDINSGTVVVNANTACDSTGTNKELDLGTGADTYVQNQLALGWVAFGVKADTEGALDATLRFAEFCAEEGACTPDPTIVIHYRSTCNAVEDLTSTDIRANSVDLDWSAPNCDTAIHSYQINYTTPWSNNPQTITTNDTETTTTSATVSSLTGLIPYSFRVSPWATVGETTNSSGNVLNITTDFDPTEAFTPGTFNISQTGTDARTIKFVRTDIDSTTVQLDVIAPNTYELACNFHYKFANTNKTYTNIANVSLNADEDDATFQFNDANNEIIDALCWDQYTNDTGKYIITITDFPLLQQIANFRAGDYGTSGNFGSLDLISIMVAIFAMVGFNRVNHTVGAVMGLFIVGGLAVLSNGEIISWATTFTAGFAVVIMWAIATTRTNQ